MTDPKCTCHQKDGERQQCAEEAESALKLVQKHCETAWARGYRMGVASAEERIKGAEAARYRSKQSEARMNEKMTDLLEKAEAERDKAIHAAETCKPKWKTCSAHGDADPHVWGCPECVRVLRDANMRLCHAADTYMAAVVCHNENPWDRANVRKYAAAKDALREVIKMQPNPLTMHLPN